MKKCLLIDADSKIPNLALMKLSTHFKGLGFSVDLVKADISYYSRQRHPITIDAEGYDGVFISYVFEGSDQFLKIINNTNITIGGVGVCLKTKLSDEIEKLPPDYSIYPENDISYGFITRGCIRCCEFCKVPEKEGKIKFINHPKDIIEHKKVKFLDNNILAYKDHLNILQWLVDNKINFQFNQGLDIRLINEKNARLLGQSKSKHKLIFAFDNLKDNALIDKKLSIIKQYIPKPWRMKFFLYCNAEMDIYGDVLYRVRWCYKNKVLPYLMRDHNCWDSENRDFYIDLCAWCNQPQLFKHMSFEEYIIKRQPKNIKRQQRSMKLFYKSRKE